MNKSEFTLAVFQALLDNYAHSTPRHAVGELATLATEVSGRLLGSPATPSHDTEKKA